jgi:DNA-binding MarR family transcriptional regulator
VSPSLTVAQLQVFLLVASKRAISQSELEDLTDLSDASVSRILALLGQYGNRGTDPLNLIEVVPDANDRRRKEYLLTQRGRRVLAQIGNHLSRYKGVSRDSSAQG